MPCPTRPCGRPHRGRHPTLPRRALLGPFGASRGRVGLGDWPLCGGPALRWPAGLFLTDAQGEQRLSQQLAHAQVGGGPNADPQRVTRPWFSIAACVPQLCAGFGRRGIPGARCVPGIGCGFALRRAFAGPRIAFAGRRCVLALRCVAGRRIAFAGPRRVAGRRIARELGG
ncbi:MAG: hypothetical protein ACRDQ1_01795, partial [Sciscionella sp.]